MLIKNAFEVGQPLDTVWQFFEDIPQVAACLPGAELTDDLGDDKYHGSVGVRMGPVKLQFAGTAEIKERDEPGKRIVVDASGADEKGRGQAAMMVTARLTSAGTRDAGRRRPGPAAVRRRRAVRPRHDLRRHRRPHAATSPPTCRPASRRIERGEDPDQRHDRRSASGFAIGVRALRMALGRVFRRFFLPYQPNAS